jgi:hypothetical protein
MSEATAYASGKGASSVKKLTLVAAGIVLGQAVLYGPSLVGAKVLLPLGALAEAGKYIPHSPGAPEIESRKSVLLDLVTLIEPDRRFAARELAEGRFPRWNPHVFGGAPFIWPSYSPFYLFSALSESPVLVAWAQLLMALVAGFGAFAFCRRVLQLGYWPSALAAWCYPVTGWFILFQGCTTGTPVSMLPWTLYAVDRTVRGQPAGAVGLALATGLVLVSGHLDIAGQVLLVSGLYALWCVWDVHRGQCLRYFARKGAVTLTLGFGLGFLLAAPYLLPFQEYARTSDRFSRRGEGMEERPPVGIVALPQIVLPDMYGAYAEKGTCPLLEPIEGNQLESPATSYTGLLATLLLAPWALLDRRRRSAALGLLGLSVFGFSWALNIPGLVQILRLPILNIMSHNRLVFASSFAILALAAIGLEGLLAGGLSLRRRWWWLQVGLLAGFFAWSLYRSFVFPEPLATVFESKVRAGQPDIWLVTVDAVREAQAWFSQRYLHAAVLCGAGLLIWMVVRFRPSASRLAFSVVGVLAVSDLLGFGIGKRINEDPSLYYPEVPALREVATATPGRVIGVGCLPANISQAVGLMDIRGYDSVDPARLLRLMALASAEGGHFASYAATQYFHPKLKIEAPDTIRFSPVFDMLSVRWAIFRGIPSPGITPRFRSEDYWVLENRRALPRAFVPQRVESATNEKKLLANLGRSDFDARRVAYVESHLSMRGPIRGNATITEEIPSRIKVDVQMETTGLLVLADNWDKGWRAYVDGRPASILRTNYTLRGVVVNPGTSTVEFRHESSTLALGNGLALLAIAVLLTWTGVAAWRRRARRAEERPPVAASQPLAATRAA